MGSVIDKTLLDLTLQGDPGTLETAEVMQNIKLMTPRQLYMLWERQQWAAQDIDFTQDRADWAAMSEMERDLRIYTLCAFFLGEERVTATFAPYVLAAEDPNEEAFTSTQLVDEARHAIFFDRFFSEAIGFDKPDYQQRLDRAGKSLQPAFFELFDDKLQTTVDALRLTPDDTALKVRAITIYHMVIEGTLALTGQHFLIENYTEQKILPGFVAGFENVARDEHRHVAYGTWYLQQAVQRDRSMIKVIQDTLAETLPLAANVLLPPPHITPADIEKFSGRTLEEQHEYAFKSLSRRLKAIGVPLTGES